MGTLYQGAKNAVEVCMGVKPDERILIVTDKAEYEVGDALKKAALKITPNVSLVVLEDYGKRPMKIIPKEIKNMIPKTDVTLWAAESQKGEITIRRDFRVTATKYARHAHMPDITKQVMEQGMCSDYAKIYEFTNKLLEKVNRAKEIKIANASGTNLKIELNSAWKWVASAGIYHKKGMWGNLPEGEVFTTPFRVNGRIVVDELGDWFDSKYGVLSPPESKNNVHVCIDIKDSTAVLNTLECGNQQLKKDLLLYLKTDGNSVRVGEFSFPTNLELLNKPLIGNLLQDEKARIHIAFGEAYPETGAIWECNTHVDCLMKNCNVWVDDRKIMENDRYLL